MKKYFILFILGFLFTCKIKNQNIQTKKIFFDKKLIAFKNFVNKNKLDNDNQIYIISFFKENQDTLIYFSKTYMPEIIDNKCTLEYKGGFLIEEKTPVLIVDYKKSLGNDFYNNELLKRKIIEVYKNITHPSNFLRNSKTEKYKISNKKIFLIGEQKVPIFNNCTR